VLQKRAASSNVPHLERSRRDTSDLVAQAASLSRAARHPEIKPAADHRDRDDIEQGPDDLERQAGIIAEMQRLEKERLEIKRQLSVIHELSGFATMPPQPTQVDPQRDHSRQDTFSPRAPRLELEKFEIQQLKPHSIQHLSRTLLRKTEIALSNEAHHFFEPQRHDARARHQPIDAIDRDELMFEICRADSASDRL
jgi:hypothetical protein